LRLYGGVSTAVTAMGKYQDKYRIPSARWAAWDYSSNAAYFITICTARREHCFGAVANGAMALTSVGQAALDCWLAIPAHFPFVVLDEFCVMPNHVHGILAIDNRVGGAGHPLLLSHHRTCGSRIRRFVKLSVVGDSVR